MDRGPNHLSRSRSRIPNRARRSINVDDVAEDQLRDIVVRGQQEWRSRSGASEKALGVLCILPGCTAKVMFTQIFANHFRAQHGMDRYTHGDRDQYERAIYDSELYRDSTQMTRVLQHRLQNQELGLQQVACNVSTVSGTVDDQRCEVLMSARNTGSTAGLARAVDGITEEVQDIDRKLEMLFTTIMQDFDKKLQGLHKSVVEEIRKDIFKLAEGLNTSISYIFDVHSNIDATINSSRTFFCTAHAYATASNNSSIDAYAIDFNVDTTISISSSFASAAHACAIINDRFR
ncbi:hypothetical protein PF006_g31506, partial [Phytophthora fragariae]